MENAVFKIKRHIITVAFMEKIIYGEENAKKETYVWFAIVKMQEKSFAFV